MSTTMSKHAISRVRHEPRRRLLTVRQVERITPAMARVTLGGDLAGFVSASYDDHVKVFFPLPGDTKPTLPDPGPNGREPTARRVRPDATTRRAASTSRATSSSSTSRCTTRGPATDWAAQAAPGHQLAVGGPRGSFVVPDDFDWYLFIGDETALPAIGRRLEELRDGARALVVAAVTGPEEQQVFQSRASVETHLGASPAVARRGPRAAARRGARAARCRNRVTAIAGRRASRRPRNSSGSISSPSAVSTRRGSRPRATGSAARSAFTRRTTTEARHPLPRLLQLDAGAPDHLRPAPAVVLDVIAQQARRPERQRSFPWR